ncbi:glycosyltransferase family 2 protein [Oceanimonas baumannii]|nr:glycosyltransferase family 2 protein [Oceanimonas baumannii]
MDESYPKVSVIVLTYNNLELTQACLNSIERFTDYPNLELILVDNASSDGTPEFLQNYAIGKDHVKVCLNDENLGFSAGNNVGLAAATGDYLVILNNDTFVTQGWLHGLVRALKRHSELGLVGPVTNNIGNEARINIHYANMEQMTEQAAQYTQSHSGEIYPARCAAFFCVMFSRETYLAVGPMDEDFGVGFFEDDDYCNRVRQLGLKVGIVEDVFVHHHLSASFNKLKAGTKQALFERNKAIYESKWGEWQPHTYRPGVN